MRITRDQITPRATRARAAVVSAATNVRSALAADAWKQVARAAAEHTAASARARVLTGVEQALTEGYTDAEVHQHLLDLLLHPESDTYGSRARTQDSERTYNDAVRDVVKDLLPTFTPAAYK